MQRIREPVPGVSILALPSVAGNGHLPLTRNACEHGNAYQAGRCHDRPPPGDKQAGVWAPGKAHHHAEKPAGRPETAPGTSSALVS